jgi:periplasmic protein CpxP/Spy
MKSMTRIGAALGVAILTVGVGAAAIAVGGDQAPGIERHAPGGLFGFAQGGPGGPGGRGRMGGPGRGGPLAGLPLRELNLSDAQREQVKAIVDSHQAEMKAVGDRAMTARQALHAATTSASFDEAAVRARAAELAAVEADVAVGRARIFSDVYQILTPEQQAKVKELSGSRPPRPNAQR